MKCSRRLVTLLFLLIGGISIHAQNAFKRQIYTPNEISGDELQITTLDHGMLFVGRTYNTVSSQQSVILIKTDSLGNMQWSKRFGPVTAYSFDIVQSPDSTFLLCYINSAILTDAYQFIKLDDSGNVISSFQITPSAPNKVVLQATLQAKSNGNYYIHGALVDSLTMYRYWHLFEIDMAGTVQWSTVYNLSTKSSTVDLDTCSNGDIITLGYLHLSSQYLPVLTRFSSTGNYLWSNMYTRSAGNFYTSVLHVTSDDHFLIGGAEYPYAADAIIMRTDENGNPIWTFEYGGTTTFSYPIEIKSTTPSELTIVGISSSSGFLMRIDTSGLILSSRKYPIGITSFSRLSTSTFALSGHSQTSNLAFILTTDTLGIGCDDQSETTSKISIDIGTMPIFGSYALPMITTSVPFFPLPPNLQFADSCGVLTSITEPSVNSFVSIFPSPANNYLVVESETELSRYDIYDYQGNNIRSKICDGLVQTIDVGNLAPGIFFIQIATDGQLFTQKFVINR